MFNSLHDRACAFGTKNGPGNAVRRAALAALEMLFKRGRTAPCRPRIELLDQRLLLSSTVATPASSSSEIDLTFSVDDPTATTMQLMRDSTVIYSGAL